MNVFDSVPDGFFNCLASSSSHRAYAGCLGAVYGQYNNAVSYRLPRADIRDSLALYLLQNHIELKEDGTEDLSAGNDQANFVIRKFVASGYLEEETDDTTFEKFIVMTDNGIALAEFLEKLSKPSRPEYSNYILNIYNRLKYQTNEQKSEPYSLILKPVFEDAKVLSSSLKKLSTSIKKIIETMLHEGSLASLTENIIKYCDGDFIREYSRLVKQQNIHLYRNFITQELERLRSESFEKLSENLMGEEKISVEEAEEKISEMIDSTKTFLHDDYNKIFEIFDSKIMTVENLTSFNRIKDSDTFFIFLSGYHNSAKQEFLKKIFSQNANKEFYHFGDIDPDGFFILENLRSKTKIDFKSYKMGITELEKYSDFTKPLEKNDIVKAGSLIKKSAYTEILNWMLSHNQKLEQEIISWKEGF